MSYTKKDSPYFISQRFKKEVTLHIVKNLLNTKDKKHIPLLLGIHGPSGEGKTFTCEKILKELNIETITISGGQFENEHAGKPAEIIRNYYLDAGNIISSRKYNGATLLINDIDTGIGNFGDNHQYTVNTQTVIGELMHLVDYPEQVENRRTVRVPIIITGNDFTKIYKPLSRAGRMTAFQWIPNKEEKIEILKTIFPNLSENDYVKIITELGNQSIAFYSNLKTMMIDDSLWDYISREGINEIFSLIKKRKTSPKFQYNINIDKIIEIGNSILSNNDYSNHLIN